MKSIGFEKGDALYDRGLFEDAIHEWKETAALYQKQRDADGVVQALIRQAAACHELGQHKLAVSLLRDASERGRGVTGNRRQAELKGLLGMVQSFSREAAEAEALLRESLRLARIEKDPELIAAVLNNLGVLLSARGDRADAMAAFEEVLGLARSAGRAVVAAKAHKNLADTALATGDMARVLRETDLGVSAVKALPDGHDKAFLLIGLSRLYQQLFVGAPELHNRLRLVALEVDREAVRVGEAIGDSRAQSSAIGHQGELYEFEGRFMEAVALTRRALRIAQQIQAPDFVYRWQWQVGRILAKQGQSEAAISSYRMAVFTLQSIRNDIAIRYGNQNARSSFREAVGELYMELADLLLKKAAQETESPVVQVLLLEARDTAELLKAAELEDYFQDDCVNLLKAKKKKIDRVSPTSLVVYIVPLPDRTEVLLSLPSGELARFKADLSDEQFRDCVRRFRLNLENRTTNEYLEQAQFLYRALIQPVEAFMEKYHCDTMVFVPDGCLRTIPMSALHDGTQFLIEKYAVAVTPGLDLMESQVADRSKMSVLISGLSEAVGGFPALIHVPDEVSRLKKLYPQSGPMMNREFLRASVSDRITREEFSIVHIASHGHFDQDIRKSFVLTFDSRLTLDDLERCIRPAQLRDHPLDMLALSACQTAAGDDRAALGLAGVAVKAGARSAFATLWFVNDKASTSLVGEFYKQLQEGSTQGRNKAQALQSAQKTLLLQESYRHPCYWAPYLIIGNWL